MSILHISYPQSINIFGIVMDNADLVRLGNYIHNSTILDDCLSHVFFTGEGAVNMGRNLTGDFLQMQYIGDEIEYVPALPVFIG